MEDLKPSTLYVIATPIGNLGDVTLRALEILKQVDLIACEDTRQTSKLLNRYEIKKPLVSYHQHSKVTKVDYLIGELKKGKSLALVSDAGTPGISDPGNLLVKEAQVNNFQVVPIPGACALTTLASVSGLPTDKFLFLGFPPHKKGRETFFKRVGTSKETVIFYESPHRFLKTLEQLKKALNGSKRQVVIGRELTKVFEEVVKGEVRELIEYFEDKIIKGEFVVAVES